MHARSLVSRQLRTRAHQSIPSIRYPRRGRIRSLNVDKPAAFFRPVSNWAHRHTVHISWREDKEEPLHGLRSLPSVNQGVDRFQSPVDGSVLFIGTVIIFISGESKILVGL